MATALNMTMPLKQDAESQANLEEFKSNFATEVQPAIHTALAQSEIVHYARVLVLHNKYIQVITEFDGEPLDYSEFFRIKLPEVFKKIFSLVEGVPSWDDLNNSQTFAQVSESFNVKSLGAAVNSESDEGYLFCAYGDKTVREILASES